MPPGLSHGAINAATFNAVKGMTVRYAIHPALAGDGLPGTKFTAQAGDWSAAWVDLVAALGIPSDFWICSVLGNRHETDELFEFQLADATPTVLVNGFFDVKLTGAAGMSCLAPFALPAPLYMAANAQIQAKVGAVAAKYIYLAILYATLL